MSRDALLPLAILVSLALSSPAAAGPASAGSPALDPSGLPLPRATATAAAPHAQASPSDGTWYPVPMGVTPTIGARQEHTIVYDPVRHRFLAFGGRRRFAPVLFNDAWERPLGGTGEWTPLAVTGTPPAARRGHSAVYDPIGDRMIVYAGYGGAYRSDVWELTLSGVPHWNQLLPTGTAPAARFGHSAVFDASRNRMVVWGGFPAGAPDSTQIWFLDCTTSPPVWQSADVPGTVPGARGQHAAIYDPVRDRMVVFGGTGSTGTTLGDVWTLSFSPALAWAQQAVNNPFGPRSLAGSAYDPVNDRMVVSCGHGSGSGQFNDFVLLDLGTLSWGAVFPATRPAAREAAGFAFDPASQTAILQGGYGTGQSEAWTDTWSLSLVPTPTWTNLVPNPSPWPPGAFRYASAGIYDAARNRFLATSGGYDAGSLVVLNDLLSLRVGTDSAWVPINPPETHVLFGRVAHSAVYDPIRDRMIVFGGYDGFTFLNDCWEVRLSPAVTVNSLPVFGAGPSQRDYCAMIYDPIRDRLVVFGGNHIGTPVDDVFAANLSGTPNWGPIPIVGPKPSARYLMGSLYDPYADRMLIFGGFDGAISRNDLFGLSIAPDGHGTWSRLIPAGVAPSPRYGATMVLDPNRQRALLYGGKDAATGTEYGDVWQLALGGQTLAWSELAPAGTLPPARYVQLGLFDGVHDRLLISGGASQTTGTLSDMWRLQFGDAATATAIALVSSDARSDEVLLKWGLSGDAATYARLERRDDANDWRTIESGPVSGSFVTYEDRDVVAGRRYAYRVTAVAGAEMSTSAEVWIDVPAGPQFSLAGFSPNPATREARMAFSLAERTPATIEVVDVGGRRVASRRIESPSPGAQSIAIAPEGGLSPGLYFVRLTQGGRTLVARGSVMR